MPNQKNLGVGYLPLSNTIAAGTISADGTYFLSDKQDVTDDALHAVAEYVNNTDNKPKRFRRKNGTCFQLIIQDIPDPESQDDSENSES